MNGSRSLVEIYVGRRYTGTLKMSLDESAAFLEALKKGDIKTRNKKSAAAPDPS